MNTIDRLLYLQLIVARLGEQELMGWWDIDIAHRLGGAGFLGRIAGEDMAPLAAGDGLRLAGRIREEPFLSKVPGVPAASFFLPEPTLLRELDRRYIHYKKYREDVPAEILTLLDPQKDWSLDELQDLMKPYTTGVTYEVEGTSHGWDLSLPGKKLFSGGEEALQACASAYLSLGKGSFKLIYYRISV